MLLNSCIGKNRIHFATAVAKWPLLTHTEEVFEKAYSASPPVECPLDETSLTELLSTMPARSTHSSVNNHIGNARVFPKSQGSQQEGYNMMCDMWKMMMQNCRGHRSRKQLEIELLKPDGGGSADPATVKALQDKPSQSTSLEFS